MDSVRPKRVPWKSWSDFTGWAQDFSLRQKVLGGFLGVVLLVGLVTILIGSPVSVGRMFSAPAPSTTTKGETATEESDSTTWRIIARSPMGSSCLGRPMRREAPAASRTSPQEKSDGVMTREVDHRFHGLHR